jgi:hypothetical protein
MPCIFFIIWRWKQMSHREAEDSKKDFVGKFVDGHLWALLVCTTITQ